MTLLTSPSATTRSRTPTRWSRITPHSSKPLVPADFRWRRCRGKRSKRFDEVIATGRQGRDCSRRIHMDRSKTILGVATCMVVFLFATFVSAGGDAKKDKKPKEPTA